MLLCSFAILVIYPLLSPAIAPSCALVRDCTRCPRQTPIARVWFASYNHNVYGTSSEPWLNSWTQLGAVVVVFRAAGGAPILQQSKVKVNMDSVHGDGSGGCSFIATCDQDPPFTGVAGLPLLQTCAFPEEAAEDRHRGKRDVEIWCIGPVSSLSSLSDAVSNPPNTPQPTAWTIASTPSIYHTLHIHTNAHTLDEVYKRKACAHGLTHTQP